VISARGFDPGRITGHPEVMPVQKSASGKFPVLTSQGTIMFKRTLVFFVGIILMLMGMAFCFYAMSVLGRFLPTM
jgi:hypothetical protein